MKLLLLLALLITPLLAKDPIEGEWIKSDGTARIKMWLDDNKQLQGMITWVKDKNRTHDTNNPNPALRKRRLRGLRVISGFTKAGTKFTGGTVYDSASGKIYKGKIWNDGDDKIVMRAFVGISLLGKSAEWNRYKKK
ncbi:MAG: DUF2147 domain-containing protein [Verrucomicrobiaceae bacterium]